MFDIVSKNKKLSFLISFLNDNISDNKDIFKEFINIQNKTDFIQIKINKIQPKVIQNTSHVKHNKHDHKYSINAQTPPTLLSNPPTQPTQTKKIIPYSKYYTSKEKTIILDGNTNLEYIIHAFLICIDSTFIRTKDNLKKDYIQTLKYKLAVELDTKNLYKEFNYNKIRSLKKTILQNSLFNNKDIQYIHLYRYLGDYFNVNFICIIDNIFVQYFNTYKDKRINIILHQKSTAIHLNTELYQDDVLYSVDDNINQYINYPGQTFKEYNKLKLKDIQTIATKKNINIRKIPHKIKTKKELIEEILNIH